MAGCMCKHTGNRGLADQAPSSPAYAIPSCNLAVAGDGAQRTGGARRSIAGEFSAAGAARALGPSAPPQALSTHSFASRGALKGDPGSASIGFLRLRRCVCRHLHASPRAQSPPHSSRAHHICLHKVAKMTFKLPNFGNGGKTATAKAGTVKKATVSKPVAKKAGTISTGTRKGGVGYRKYDGGASRPCDPAPSGVSSAHI